MKKFRLAVSLAMMFVSIAVLCFGVYAASSVTYTISGTIKYEIQDVFCTVSGKVYTTTDFNVASDTLGTNMNSNYKNDSTTASSTLTGFSTNGSETGSPYAVSESLNIDFSKTAYTYYVVFKITNNTASSGGKTLYAKLSISPTSNTSLNCYNSASSAVSIAGGASAYVGFAYSLASKTTDVSVNLSASLSLSYTNS